MSSLGYEVVTTELLERPTMPIPLEPAVPIESLPTPVLLLDEAGLTRNIEKMAAFLGSKGKGFRPHAKTHKCPEIARRQMVAGAIGICAAKVSEAFVLVNAGIDKVLVTSAILSPAKADVLVALSRQAQIDVVVDSMAGFEVLAAALSGEDQIGVLVDLDVELGRTGTRSDSEALTLAERISASSHMTFRGVQHYAGHLMHVEGFTARRDRSLALWETVAGRVQSLVDAGFPCEVVTGCGTGTFNIDCDVEVVTDLQVGSYVFMDQEYRLIGGEDSELFDDFEVTLTVATTAISQPMGAKAVTVDGGYKVFASDSVNPEPLDLAGSRFRFFGDEHGVLLLADGSQQPTLGSLQRFITPHCDPTVNLHDAYWVHDEDAVYSRWPISARGCSW
ncbi:MAG: DSD1 family PLP-dependent enzyme [Gammaproteobacteria bacterium]|nr:MAG: DSD1 family PLP-dependent enzyme [Gammaproteobacteria bacterium]